MLDMETTPATGSTLERAFTLIEWVLVGLSGLAVLASGAITFVSVIGRWLFGWSVPDGEIIVADLMIVACVLPLAVVAGRRAHIAVDLVVRRLPTRIRRGIDRFNGVLGTLILIGITWSGWLNLETAWTRNGYYDGRLEWPEWPARLVFVIGYALFVLRSLHRSGDSPSTGPAVPEAPVVSPGPLEPDGPGRAG